MNTIVFLDRTETGYTNIKKLEDAILSFPPGKRLVVNVSDKKRRSDAQNRYFHSCVGIFGDALGYTKEEAKSIVKFKFLKREKVNPDTGEVFEYLAETHKLSKEEFTELMEQFTIWAAQLGVVLPQPGEQFQMDIGG